jgi:hypothetical protein
MTAVPTIGPAPDIVEWAAQRTVAMHRPDGTAGITGRCAQCLPDGTCPELRRAIAYLHLPSGHSTLTGSRQPPVATPPA